MRPLPGHPRDPGRAPVGHSPGGFGLPCPSIPVVFPGLCTQGIVQTWNEGCRALPGVRFGLGWVGLAAEPPNSRDPRGHTGHGTRPAAQGHQLCAHTASPHVSSPPAARLHLPGEIRGGISADLSPCTSSQPSQSRSLKHPSTALPAPAEPVCS